MPKKQYETSPKNPTNSTDPAVKHAKREAYAFIGLGFALALVAVGLQIHTHKASPHAPPGAVQTAAKSSIKPTQKAIDSYTVARDLPKYISIPVIGVPKTRIIQLGLSKNSQIAAPDNIYDTGWYKGSAKPGQPGAMFIYGHVSSWTADGVFYDLKKLKPGNDITITRGDDTTYTYRVVSSKNYPYNAVNMSQVLASVNAKQPGLNLMTCTGTIIKGTSEFSERLVVFTSLVKE